jgi:DNA repair protein RadD
MIPQPAPGKSQPSVSTMQFETSCVSPEAIRAAYNEGIRRVLLVSPAGSGKTVIASKIIADLVAEYWLTLVLAHRRGIVFQTSKELYANGVDHGIILSGQTPRPQARVQVASIQTLHARAIRREEMPLPPAKLINIDECHHIRARSWIEIINQYPDAFIIGQTATPCRGDGRGLCNIFEVMIECPSVAELIKQGHLVPTRVYAPVDPDLRGVKTQSGDYIVSQLSDRMNNDRLVGDIVEHWFKYGENRRTIAFACDVAHSIHIVGEFCRAGVRAEHIDGSTPADERDAILARLDRADLWTRRWVRCLGDGDPGHGVNGGLIGRMSFGILLCHALAFQ